MAVVCFLFIYLFLPETMRTIAGDGSAQIGRVYRPPIPLVGRSVKRTAPLESARKAPMNPFPILLLPDIVLTLSFTGVVYAVNYTVTSTIASAFAVAYPQLSETVLGLCYLPTGLGMIVGSTFVGKLLDREYARLRAKAEAERGDEWKKGFRKEYARLRTMPGHLAVFIAALVAWGWFVEKRVSIGGPLVLQVVCEFRFFVYSLRSIFLTVLTK